MHGLAILISILTMAGHLWFAWEVWQREDLTWALLLLFIPFPLLGLYIWHQAGWDSCYRNPAILYFSGYALGLLVGIV
ncbi:MAG: hypothetical protein HY823_03210 [Acidobacteria bacterium]|nr:hypothetical protein [Acidobacteriota bacterium]